ncbi:MAG: MBL fold metallo-hydrolase [Clostridia bacterium]|nr:MBL fold metallo-hydrolase [Clostridia bacterium]
MDYRVISTGSQGNAVVINGAVLIDCGVSFRAVEPFLKGIKLVLLTHIHGDHFKPSTLRRMAAERPLLRFAACSWLMKPLLDLGVRVGQIDLLEPDRMYDYGMVKVIPVSLVHDVPNCGYKLHFPAGEKMLYATDTANLNGIFAPNYDLYMIESNYSDEEIQQRIQEKKANGQYVYEYRVLGTHLSRAKCDDFFYRNVGPGSELVYMHEHHERGGEADEGRAS